MSMKSGSKSDKFGPMPAKFSLSRRNSDQLRPALVEFVGVRPSLARFGISAKNSGPHHQARFGRTRANSTKLEAISGGKPGPEPTKFGRTRRTRTRGASGQGGEEGEGECHRCERRRFDTEALWGGNKGEQSLSHNGYGRRSRTRYWQNGCSKFGPGPARRRGFRPDSEAERASWHRQGFSGLGPARLWTSKGGPVPAHGKPGASVLLPTPPSIPREDRWRTGEATATRLRQSGPSAAAIHQKQRNNSKGKKKKKEKQKKNTHSKNDNKANH